MLDRHFLFILALFGKCVHVHVSCWFSVGSFAIISQPAAGETVPPPPVLSALHFSWLDTRGSDNDTLCPVFHDLLMILVEAEACRRQNEELLKGCGSRRGDGWCTRRTQKHYKCYCPRDNGGW